MDHQLRYMSSFMRLRKTTSGAQHHQHFINTPPTLTSYHPLQHLNTSQINPLPNFPPFRAPRAMWTFTRTAYPSARPSLAATGCWEWSRSIVIDLWLIEWPYGRGCQYAKLDMLATCIQHKKLECLGFKTRLVPLWSANALFFSRSKTVTNFDTKFVGYQCPQSSIS